MRVGIYLGDQDWARTLSKGIYAYSRALTGELVERLPAHDFVLIVNRQNRPDMTGSLHRRVRLVELPTTCARGPARLLSDQFLAPLLARHHTLDLLHFPKGFLPLSFPSGIRLTATIHDTIPLHYERHYRGYFSRTKLRYFRIVLAHTLRRAHGIMTDSLFSLRSLNDLASRLNLSSPPIEMCEPTPDPVIVRDACKSLQPKTGASFLHLGSPLPHKRTRETIALFAAYNRAHDHRWELRVTGLSAPPPGWLPAGQPRVHFLGTLPPQQLRAEIEHARVLLLLSDIEGFGMPALEAWFLGTPVCYSSGGSLPEILAGTPGLCPEVADAPFSTALDTLLALHPDTLSHHRARLRARFSPERFGTRAAALVTQWLHAPPRLAGN